MKTVGAIEQKAINAMFKLHENKFTLQVGNITIHGVGYLSEFKLSNGEEYFVKVYNDNSEPKVYKMI